MKKTALALLAALTIPFLGLNAYASKETAQCVCVMNAATGEIVYEKNAYDRRPMASTTKIMTAYVALKNSNLQDIVTVSRNAQYQEGSAMYINEGDKIPMEDMIYGLMLNSGNDAAVAIAEHISGSSEAFVDLMNKTAWEMGAGDTMFCNPNGLPNDFHYTTAENLAIITRNALRLPAFKEIVSTKARTAWAVEPRERVYELYNHNKLLGKYDGAIGVKTGYTEKAGRCLVSAAERDGMEFIAVTLNDNDDWNTHTELLDEAFREHYPKKAVEKGEVLKELYVNGNKYTFSAADDVIVPMKNNVKQKINIQLHLASDLSGSINKGEKVGYAKLTCDGNEIDTIDIVSDNDIIGVGKARLVNSFYECWKNIWDFFLV